MCDYSLMGVPNRLAREGEELVVYEFRTGSQGLTPPESLEIHAETFISRLMSFFAIARTFIENLAFEEVAVCIPPGACLLLRDIPEDMRRSFGVEASEEVIFTQLDAEAYEYRDAMRFKNGREILLQDLKKGQRVKVLQLSLTDEPVPSVPEVDECFDLRMRRFDFIAPRLVR
jgi:hypothetical protein